MLVAAALTGVLLLVWSQLVMVQKNITNSADTTSDINQLKNEVVQRLNNIFPEGMPTAAGAAAPLSNCQKLLGGARCYYIGASCTGGQTHPAGNPQAIVFTAGKPDISPLKLYNVSGVVGSYNSSVFLEGGVNGTRISNGKAKINSINFVPISTGDTIYAISASAVAANPANLYVIGNLEIQVIGNNTEAHQLGTSMSAANPLKILIPMTVEVQSDTANGTHTIADCSSANPDSLRPITPPACANNQALIFDREKWMWKCETLTTY